MEIQIKRRIFVSCWELCPYTSISIAVACSSFPLLPGFLLFFFNFPIRIRKFRANFNGGCGSGSFSIENGKYSFCTQCFYDFNFISSVCMCKLYTVHTRQIAVYHERQSSQALCNMYVFEHNNQRINCYVSCIFINTIFSFYFCTAKRISEPRFGVDKKNARHLLLYWVCEFGIFRLLLRGRRSTKIDTWQRNGRRRANERW